MRGEPSPNLVSLLARLKLATADDLRAVASRVRRLAGDLPDFESVWVDALAQARVLTPFQAAEVNAGRGEALVKGPYVITRPLSGPHYAACYEARKPNSSRSVRLYVVSRGQLPASETLHRLCGLIELSATLAGTGAGTVEDAALAGDDLWAVCGAIEGVSAADWMAENGRFPPQVVFHVARQTIARLADFEQFGIVHGDVGASGLLLQTCGHIALPMAGLRAIARPSEGYSFGDLRPEGYDYLAPERIADGGPPTVRSDLYACGSLWWHLLSGRPPFQGGNSLAKLKAVHAAKVVDVRQLAPEAPEVLVAAIELCMARDPASRPHSASELATLLGPPTRAGAAQLSQCLRQGRGLWQHNRSSRGQRPGGSKPLRLAAGVAAALLITAAGAWTFWRGRSAVQVTAAVSTQSPAKPEATRPSRLPPDVRPAPESRQSADASKVKLATATVPVPPSGPEPLVLPTGKKLSPSTWNLKPFGRVHGADGKRALVSVPAEGLTVDCEGVSFDGIDFVWEQEDQTSRRPSRATAMIRVAAQEVEFRGCSFSTAAGPAPVAIAWTGNPQTQTSRGGEIVFADCAFSGVAAVVECRIADAIAVEMTNALCLTAGPVVRLQAMPRAGDAVKLSLKRVTLRGDSAVLECRYARTEERPGAISIAAVDCVMDTDRQGGLLVFLGAQRPDRLLTAITWSGQGSFISQRTPMATWRPPGKKQQVLPEEDLEVGGLVRSGVEFAGQSQAHPSASRLVRWQGPLRSVDPPGVQIHALSLPGR